MTTITAEALEQFSVYDTRVHSLTRREATEILTNLLEAKQPSHVVTVNVDFLRIAASASSLQSVINGAALAVPDGLPLVWMARYLGMKACERITGPDLMNLAAELSVKNSCKIFLLGGDPIAVAGAVDALRRRYPGVHICGAYAPPAADYPFPSLLDAEICDRIREARPDFLFVGFGCPKQEFWIRDHMATLNVPIAVGVGGTFNFLSGKIARAPGKIQNLGLEWLFRLCQEPRRLWRRYLADDLPFVIALALSEARAKSLNNARRPFGLNKAPAK